MWCGVCVLYGVCALQKEKNAPELDRQADELQKEALAVKIDEVRTYMRSSILNILHFLW